MYVGPLHCERTDTLVLSPAQQHALWRDLELLQVLVDGHFDFNSLPQTSGDLIAVQLSPFLGHIVDVDGVFSRLRAR